MLAVGLISGTSADGVDAALVDVVPGGGDVGGAGDAGHLRAKAVSWLTSPYPPEVRDAVLRVAGGAPTTAGEICRLNVAIAESFAAAAASVCTGAGVSLSDVGVIGSHGQTVWHEPVRTGAGPLYPPSTLQLGQAQVIAERTGVTTVADFRARDMAAGGQGAPLVPVVDYLLFADAAEGRIMLNIGGIANITVLPAGAEPEAVCGFDTGPGNMLVDGMVKALSGGREGYDRDGGRARAGKPDAGLLADLLNEPYYAFTPPKSTGRELFGESYLRKCLALAGARGIAGNDLIATLTLLTATTVAGAIERFVLHRGLDGDGSGGSGFRVVIAAGGGTHNPAMMGAMAELLDRQGLRLATTDDYGVPVDAKEAVAFAVLACLSM